MHKIWHREEVLMDEFGKLFGWDTEEVSERIWIGSNPDQARERYQPAYNWHRSGETRLKQFTSPGGKSEHQNRVWVRAGSFTTHTREYYGMPR